MILLARFLAFYFRRIASFIFSYLLYISFTARVVHCSRAHFVVSFPLSIASHPVLCFLGGSLQLRAINRRYPERHRLLYLFLPHPHPPALSSRLLTTHFWRANINASQRKNPARYYCCTSPVQWRLGAFVTTANTWTCALSSPD